MQLENLRLGFVSDRSAHQVAGDAIWTDAGVGRLVERWARSCRRFTLAMRHGPEKKPFQDLRLSIPLEDYLPLPWRPSIARGFRKAWNCRRVIRAVERRSDAVIVQLPFAAPLALLGAQRPRRVSTPYWSRSQSSVAKNSRDVWIPGRTPGEGTLSGSLATQSQTWGARRRRRCEVPGFIVFARWIVAERPVRTRVTNSSLFVP